MITIITPWHGHTGDLLPAYLAATHGTRRICVDNATPPPVAAALAQIPGTIRFETNHGFAAANNHGWRAVRDSLDPSDIVIFLNSDVVGEAAAWLNVVAYDVQHSALYGPSLAAQFVAGAWIPYLEGWCIAATAETWKALEDTEGNVWDASTYPQPYWEDNALSLTALQHGIALMQTQWNIAHLGGRTTGSVRRFADSFEANRATFAAHVQRTTLGDDTPPPALTAIGRYRHECATQSDIFHHLPSLMARAHGRILELGTRTGVSTAALLVGVERRGGHVISVDIDDCSALYQGHPQWTFHRASSIDPLTRVLVGEDLFDGILVDTIHNEDHVYQELTLWHTTVKDGGWIAVHDTETFPGVRVAVERFCADHTYPVTFVTPCNGMAWISVQYPY